MSRACLVAACVAALSTAGIARAESVDGNAALTRVAIGVATGRLSICQAISAANQVAKREPALVRATIDRDSYRTQIYAAAKRQLRSGQTAVQIDRAIAALRCLGDYRAAPHLLAQAFAARVSIARTDEEKAACAQDPVCAAKAIAAELCSDLADRRDVEDGLGEQHRVARETGAIDLDELADRADALEALAARIEQEEARYRAIAGRRFNRRSFPADLASRGN